jgi:RNA polymerase sigma-70 factor (ECF subfamily)
VGESVEAGQALLSLYDRALPVIYGYLFDRCRDQAVAEDLASETFLAAVATARNQPDAAVSVPWLVGVARHKLVDRRAYRQGAIDA